MKDKDWLAFLRAKIHSEEMTEEEVARMLDDQEDSPSSGTVRLVERLDWDVTALLMLMESELLVQATCRSDSTRFQGTLCHLWIC